MKSSPYRIVAHRGAHATIVENSLGSIREAIRQKADIIEVDVRMTRDREFVIFHDFFLDRMTTGQGFVITKRLAEIQKLRLLNGKPIPLLDDVLLFMEKHKKTGLLLDVKDLLIGAFDVRRFIQALLEHDLLHRAIVSSYNPWMLHRVRKRQQDVELALLTMSPYGIAVPLAKKLQARYVSCVMPIAKRWQLRYLRGVLPSESFLYWAQREGLEAMAYCEEGRDNLKWLIKRGVTLFETNRPAALRTELRKAQKEL